MYAMYRAMYAMYHAMNTMYHAMNAMYCLHWQHPADAMYAMYQASQLVQYRHINDMHSSEDHSTQPCPRATVLQ
jgi:hypothetical protein